MKPNFVKTKNYRRFMSAMARFGERGAEENRIIIVDGEPGLGKTTILQRWATDNACVYLRAKSNWKQRWFLEELLSAMKVQLIPYTYEKRFNLALKELSERSVHAEFSERQFAVVIDEADFITGRGQLVETIRDLADVGGVTFIIIGMGRIRDNLTRFPQAASRVNGYVRFEPADIEDVKLFFSERCEVPIQDDLARFIHRATTGFNRELLEAVKTVERFGLRAKLGDPQAGLSLKEMSGQYLINDRRTGRPIHIPEAV